MNEKWLLNECVGATILKDLPGGLSTAPKVFAKGSVPADHPLLFYGCLGCSPGSLARNPGRLELIHSSP